MRTLKFGVEVEFFGKNRSTVADALRAKGINVEVQGYNHDTCRCWKLVTDSSVTSSGCGDWTSSGNEIVSPILYGDEGLDELKVVLNTLDDMGCKVDKSCGVHVHHDVNDYELEDFKSLYNLQYKVQPAVNSVLPKSRRYNDYCKTISAHQLERVNSLSNLDYLASAVGTRYVVLNARSYVKYGTIEFRQHSGSLNFDKIEAWVLLTFFLVCYGKNNTVEQGGSRIRSIDKMCTLLNLDGHYLQNYLNERKVALSA